MDYILNHSSEQLVYRYVLKEVDSNEEYGKQLSIYLCELPRLKVKSMKGLNPVESWFYILKNLSKFAGTPEDIGERFAPVATAARTNKLPDIEQLKYLRSMVSESERLDIGKAYYKDGYEDAKLDDAKAMLQDGVAVEKIIQYTGLSIDDIKHIQN